ncbi:hypothetical protein N7G274_005624 [Stereocaulon virgatum]|uniref:WW domain-containing protein n=1 Tax=Stereocaulon virgatum TaxID=373712 RepID=A0ABR4A7R2_9LECA
MPSSNQPGSNTEPPFNLPSGWEARWDSDTKRHYYVQMARALPQWEVPTEPAPTAPSRESTPPQFRDPYRRSPALTAPKR